MSINDRSVIQTVGLTKIFRDFWLRQRVVAVDKLDLDVHENEVFGLLGPNGSGKSTTIKMLLGLLYPTRGRILVLGRAPTDVAIKRRIGYLPEESYLYRFLDARETLDYYGRLFQIPRPERRRRVEQLLEMVGLKREARRRVGQYSKGMARRIGLAQALINDPDLLILDEPTSGLDPVGTREMKDLIVFLNRQKKKTILLCSHLLADVEDVCQRVNVLYGGRQQAVGEVDELLRRENLTQITTDRLGDGALRRIRQIIVEEQGTPDGVRFDVTTPSDRLETFFLRIVKQAQQARQTTSGVSAGGQIADFLSVGAPEGAAVVDSLMAAAEPRPQPAAQPTTAPEHAEGERREIIEDLVSGPDAAAPREDAPAPPPQVPEQADESVLADLLGSRRPSGEDEPDRP